MASVFLYRTYNFLFQYINFHYFCIFIKLSLEIQYKKKIEVIKVQYFYTNFPYIKFQ